MLVDSPTREIRGKLPSLNERMLPKEHRQRVDELRTQINNSIVFVEYGEGSCATYALDLWNAPIYRRIALHFDDALETYAGIQCGLIKTGT